MELVVFKIAFKLVDYLAILRLRVGTFTMLGGVEEHAFEREGVEFGQRDELGQNGSHIEFGGLTLLVAAADGESLEQPRLPSTDAIEATLALVRRILFPGFYADEPLPRTSRRFRVGTWLCGLFSDLARVVYKALAHERSSEPQ